MNIEKKLALSYEELEAERMADEAPQAAASEGEESDSGEEKPIYNPKDVPLGWLAPLIGIQSLPCYLHPISPVSFILPFFSPDCLCVSGIHTAFSVDHLIGMASRYRTGYTSYTV